MCDSWQFCPTLLYPESFISFDAQKCLSWLLTFILFVRICCYSIYIYISLLRSMSWRISHMRNFPIGVCRLTFTPLIQLELTFVSMWDKDLVPFFCVDIWGPTHYRTERSEKEWLCPFLLVSANAKQRVQLKSPLWAHATRPSNPGCQDTLL